MSSLDEMNLNIEVEDRKPDIDLHANNINDAEIIDSGTTPIDNNVELKLKEEVVEISHEIKNACIGQVIDGDDCKQEIKDDTDVEFMGKSENYEEEFLSVVFNENFKTTNDAQVSEDFDDNVTTITYTVADSVSSTVAIPEVSIGLEMAVRPQRKVGRPRKDKNSKSSFKAVEAEDDLWEIVEPVVNPTNGMRRSGRKRKRKKISYIDLLDDNLDSSSNISEKSDNEWNYAEEIRSLKTEVVNPSPPLSPPLPSVTKSMNTKVAVRRRVKKSSKEESRSKIIEKHAEKVSLENGSVEVKEKMSWDEFCCKKCGMVFLSKIQFKKHQLVCTDVKSTGGRKFSGQPVTMHFCPICHKEFATRNSVKKHISSIHMNLVHISCSLCSKIIGNIHDSYEHFHKEHPSSLVKGKKISLSKGSPQCPVCDEVFKTLYLVKQHLVNRHANLVHVTCALCQRSVGSMLEYFQHFVEYHSHLTSTLNENDAVVTTNMDAAKEINLTSKKVENEFRMKPISSSSLPEDSGLVCLQCKKSIANYKLLVLHMLSHKIDKNTDTVSQNSNVPSSSDSTTDCADLHEQPDSSTSNSDSRHVDEHPFPVYCLPPDNLSSVNSVSGVLGPDLLMAVNRSLNLMIDIVAKLKSELVFGESDSFCSKDDLLRRLNTVLQYSSGITDVSKCLLLVLEECKQGGNPYVDDDVAIDIDISWNGSGDNDDNGIARDFGNDDNGCHLTDGDNDNRCNEENVLSNPETSEVDNAAACSDVNKKSELAVISSDNKKSQSEVLKPGPTAVKESNGNGKQVKDVENQGNSIQSQSVNHSKSNVRDGTSSKSKSHNSTDVNSESFAPTDMEGSSQRLKAKATVASSSKKKTGKKFICKICGKHLAKKTGLSNHMLTHTNVKPFQCNKCSAFFKAEFYLKRHILLHEKDDQFKCDFCDFTHRIQKVVQNHSREEHPNAELFSCDMCKHKAKTSFDLSIHKRIHTPRKCKQCDFEASNYNELKSHKRKNHAHKLCSLCPYTCCSLFQLRRHMRSHSKSEDDKAFCCELCGATFDSTRRLNYHVLRHENKKPLSCTQCDYKCSSSSSIASHMLKHAGVKPHKCDLCNASFYRSAALKRHKRTHSDEKEYCCRYCGKGFKYRYNCCEHEMIHTGEKKFKCKLCHFSCRRRKFLVQHLEQHKARGSDIEGCLSGSEDDTMEDFSSLLKPENLVPINNI